MPASYVLAHWTSQKFHTSDSDHKSKNWLIHRLYLRQEYPECLQLIESILASSQGLCEYAIYIKALILRQTGRVQESFQLFQAISCLHPENIENLKQVGRSLLLLGKHKAALEVYREINASYQTEQWEIHHSMAICYMYLKNYDEAIHSFQNANSITRHDVTFLQLANVYKLMKNQKLAIDLYLEALEFSPDNPEILTELGLSYLRIGETSRAFDALGNSLTHNPRYPKTILAAGSIIQDNGDMDVALVKYRVAAVQIPNAAELWNNIGMCFYGKQQYIACIACLKRALYMDPFKWIVSFNLGLVHLQTAQYASAFHFLSTAINIHPEFAASYMYLAITLNRLNDYESACSVFEKAIQMERNHLFHINYAIVLYNNGDLDKCRIQFDSFEEIFEALDEEERNDSSELLQQRQAVFHALIDSYDTLRVFMEGIKSCACVITEHVRAEREAQWRDYCHQFYYKQDSHAKELLKYVEDCKLDHKIIHMNVEEEASLVEQRVHYLGLNTCMDPGHQQIFDDTLWRYDQIKNEVRAQFHNDVAARRYEEFHALVMDKQSIHYSTEFTRPTQLPHVRQHESYVRELQRYNHVVREMSEFFKMNGKNIGVHPFILGLRQLLQWNLESAMVVGWRLSDAVFVESAQKSFADAAVNLLINDLGFGHCLIHTESMFPKHRIWLINPYLSDQDMRDYLHILPSSHRLEGHPAGDKHMTNICRRNVSGLSDEPRPFIHRWCLIL